MRDEGCLAVIIKLEMLGKQKTKQAAADCGWVAFGWVLLFLGEEGPPQAPTTKRNKHRQVASGSFEVRYFFFRRRNESPPQAPDEKPRTRTNRIRATRSRTARTNQG